MGPQATLVFYQRVLNLTAAATDQEHIETLILSDTKMPDRTRALLTGDREEIQTRLLSDVRLLEDWGAACIAVPCNTSHAFFPWLQERVNTPIVNMITGTAEELRRTGGKRAGILATDGTIQLGLYHVACEAAGIEPVTPPPPLQTLVMQIIYDEIKRGKRGDGEKFAVLDAFLREAGCDRAILACTELSVYRDWHSLPDYYLDAMDILARQSIALCGYPMQNPASIAAETTIKN